MRKWDITEEYCVGCIDYYPDAQFSTGFLVYNHCKNGVAVEHCYRLIKIIINLSNLYSNPPGD